MGLLETKQNKPNRINTTLDQQKSYIFLHHFQHSHFINHQLLSHIPHNLFINN